MTVYRTIHLERAGIVRDELYGLRITSSDRLGFYVVAVDNKVMWVVRSDILEIDHHSISFVDRDGVR